MRSSLSSKRRYSDLTIGLSTQDAGTPAARRRILGSHLSVDIPAHRDPPGNGDMRVATQDSDSEPSSASTEIIDSTPEDYVRTAKRSGIKVRDFAYEPVPPAGKPKELWLDPLFTLAYHDQHIRDPQDYHCQISGHEMRRLLDHGFVTREEAEQNWTGLDWERVKEFDESLHSAYPYSIAKPRAKPTSGLRERVRVLLFGDRSSSHVVFSSMEKDGKWDGDEETEELLKDIQAAKACGGLDFTSIRPEGGPGPTQRMLVKGNDEQTFDTPIICTSFATHIPLRTPPSSTPTVSSQSVPTTGVRASLRRQETYIVVE